MMKKGIENDPSVTRRNFIQNIGLTTAGLAVAPLPIFSKAFSGETNGGMIHEEIENKKLNSLDSDIEDYIKIIKDTIYSDYKGMYHKPTEVLPYPFITPGSVYSDDLWDWDSWLTNIALRQILHDVGTEGDKKQALEHERGCILNFLRYGGKDGWIPIAVWHNANPRENMPENIHEVNMHKPVLAQHAAFLVKSDNGNAEWLRNEYWKLQAFIKNYETYSKSESTGLFFWQDDFAIGVDNDPATFYRPKRSSGSILLNCFMFKELEAMAYLSKALGLKDANETYLQSMKHIKEAVKRNCWDERDGFYYSVDLNLLPIDNTPREYLGIKLVLHQGHPRDYNCLIQRLGVWSGFLSMWSGLATPEQAERIVKEHYKNERTFNAPYGVRTLSKMEKMYGVYPSGNPSDWQGPIWGISNYMVFRGLVKYGYQKEARELAYKTIRLLGKDAKEVSAFHEYYDPESGKPIINKGFQNWNYLVMNMIAWLENETIVEEF